MDIYFTDRQYNCLGIATANGPGPIQIIDDTDNQSVSAGARTYSGTILFSDKLANKVSAMGAAGNYIMYIDKAGLPTYMTVMEYTHDPLAGEHDFISEDAGIDLINETVGAYAADKAYSIDSYLMRFTSDSGYEMGINEIPNDARTLSWDGSDETALARILSVATQFGVELYFTFELSGTSVIKRKINVVKKRGSDKGITLYVGRDVNKIVTKGDIYDLCTSIEGTGATPEGSDKPINLKGYKWTDPDSRYVLGTDGILRDTVAVQIWSRRRSNDNPNPDISHIQVVKTYEAKTQASLLQSVLTELKKRNHESINYEVDIAKLPRNVQIGDTVHLQDEAEGLNLSARVLELKASYATDSGTAILGDFLIEQSTVSDQLYELAGQMKKLKATIQYYPWTRYADDDQGNGISALPAGKKYMATVWGATAVPSDDPKTYANKWQLVTGTAGKDGSKGDPGPAGADGRTPYVHKAYAQSVDGKTGFSTTDPSGATYLGICVDYVEADPTDPSAYDWMLTKGRDGLDGNDGLQGPAGSDGKSTYTHIAWANSADGKTDFSQVAADHSYMGMYVDSTEADSTKPEDYAWTLVRGRDGNDGTPGKPGVDGRTPYFHQAWANSADGTRDFSLTTSDGSYWGNYTDYTQADSADPKSYAWTLIQGKQGEPGQSGSDGKPGKDGVGVKSTSNVYAVSDSGITAPTDGWAETPPAAKAGQFMWTKTTWTYSDGSTEAGYAIGQIGKTGETGKDGVAGKDGVGITGTVITYAASKSGTSAPADGFTATIPTVEAGSYLWTKMVWTYSDKTTETGYSVAKMGEKGDSGPAGPAGKDITSFAKGTVLPDEVAPVNSQFWVINEAGQAQSLYVSDGTQWVAMPISASIIVAASFQGMNFDGVTFTGSTFKSTFKDLSIDGYADTLTGEATLANGQLNIVSQFSNQSGAGAGRLFMSTVSPSGWESFSTLADGTVIDSSSMYFGQLQLRQLISGSNTTKNAKYIQSDFTAADATTYERIVKLGKTANYSSATVYYMRRGFQVTVQFRFELLIDTGWVALSSIPGGYTPAHPTGVAIPSLSYQGWNCTVYNNALGWRLIPASGQGKGGYQGGLSYITYDGYPTDDAKTFSDLTAEQGSVD